MRFAGSDWLKKNLEYRKMPAPSPLGERVAEILGLTFAGIYHIPEQTLFHKRTDWSRETCISIVIREELATWDRNDLTVLVILCHDACIRFSVSAISRGYLELCFHQRKRGEVSTMRGHPTLEAQVARTRSLMEEPRE